MLGKQRERVLPLGLSAQRLHHTLRDARFGFGDSPREVAQAIVGAFEAGAVGASIEDVSRGDAPAIYDFSFAVERVAAAAESARACPVPILLTARAENHLHGIQDLDDTIRRLAAFEKVGADVLYAPGLKTLAQMELVVSSVSRPVNVVMGFADPDITLDQLAEIGVKRVSIGGALLRVALRTFLDSAAEMKAGRFGFVRNVASVSQLSRAFED